MKRLLAILTGAIVALAITSAPLFAQRPHGGGAGGGNSGATGAAMHGAGTDHGSGAENSNATAKGAAAGSPTTVLANNTKLDTHLTSLLQSKGLLPTGTDLKTACAGFKNLGQCIAAVHVRHNLKIPFACLSADMTGTAPATGTTCPAGTGASKMSLGKSIQTLSPNTSNAKTEEKSATKQADADINEAESDSKS